MLINYRIFSKVYYFLVLILLIMFGGTVGFVIIEEWDWVDSFYMTIITISTVGFQEVHELSAYGKVFTSFLIISSFGTFAYAITSITNYLIGGEYKKYLKEYKTMKELKKMTNHVIICGFGRVGRQVAEDLKAHNNDFVVIERNKDVLEDRMNDDIFFIDGDSTDDSVLESASVKTAKAVITCLPKDSENIYVVLAAREFNKEMIIVSRASNQSAVSKLKMAGASNVIMPDSIGGSHMASLIAHPDVMEFIDMIRVQGDQGCNVESISYEELPDSLRDKTIEQLESKKETGVTIIGFKNKEGEYIVNPTRDTIVSEGSRVFVLGNSHQISLIIKKYNISH